MLLVFQLNKVTGTEATFVLGKEFKFSNLKFKGYTIDNPDISANDANGIVPSVDGVLPLYLHCDAFGDNEVVFYQGRNATIDDPVTDNLIPLGPIQTELPYTFLEQNLNIIIDRITTWEASKALTFGLYQIHNGNLDLLTIDQAFGVDVDDESTPNDSAHGINLYFELTPCKSQDHDQTFTIANST